MKKYAIGDNGRYAIVKKIHGKIIVKVQKGEYVLTARVPNLNKAWKLATREMKD